MTKTIVEAPLLLRISNDSCMFLLWNMRKKTLHTSNINNRVQNGVLLK